jgi:hypothetical protein
VRLAVVRGMYGHCLQLQTNQTRSDLMANAYQNSGYLLKLTGYTTQHHCSIRWTDASMSGWGQRPAVWLFLVRETSIFNPCSPTGASLERLRANRWR